METSSRRNNERVIIVSYVPSEYECFVALNKFYLILSHLILSYFATPYVPPVDPVSLQPDAPMPLKYIPEDSIKESRKSNSKPPTIYYPPDLEPTLGKWLMAQQPTLMTSFRALVKQDLEPDHPEVITHARKMLLPPSRHWTIKLDLGAWETPQSRAALEILKNKVFIPGYHNLYSYQ